MVYAKNFKISRILLIALVIVSMVAFTSYTAPKALAVAGTLTSVFLMLVMSVMASLGVTLLSSVLDDGIDYLQEQYGLYVSEHGYSSIEEYLLAYGVNSVSKLCVPILGAINVGKTVYDLIADFCSWLFEQENVVSGGSDVGDVPSTAPFTYSGSYGSASSSYWLNDTTFRLVLNVGASSSSSQSSNLRITLPSDFSSGTVRITLPTASSSTSPSSVLYNGSYLYMLRINYFTGTTTYTFYRTDYGDPPVISFNSNVLNFTVSNTYWYYYASSGGQGQSYRSVPGTTSLDFVFSASTSSGGGFVISPSATVLDPPVVSAGQEYTVTASGVLPTDSVDTAVSTAVAPLTSADGLTTTAEVTGTAIPTEWEWLYEAVEAIEQNTSDDRHGTDFIPNNATVDFGFWHYVPDWISSVGTGFAFFVGLVTSLPSIMLAPLYGILVLGVVVALFHKLWGS